MRFARGGKIWIHFSLIILLVCISCCYVYGDTPSNVRVTNVRGTQFTISWTSNNEEAGYVRYGASIDDYATWTSTHDDRGAATIDDIHHVTITGLTPDTTYYYEIISGSTTDDNGGNFYSLNPGPALTPVGSCQPAGRVFKDQAKTQPAYDSIVYVTILGSTEDLNSAPESVLVTTASNGYWFLDLVNFRTRDYSALYSYTCGTGEIRVEAQGANDGIAVMTTAAIDFTTAESPDLILAEGYTVTFWAGSGGTLAGNTAQTVPYGGNCTAVTAVPDTGYQFTSWSDGSTQNPRTVTNVTSTMNLTANFAQAIHTVDLELSAGWSMISLPVEPEDATINTLFPDAIAVYRFTTEYELLNKTDSLVKGEGYWIYMNAAHTYSLEGAPIEGYTIPNISSGWSMIGGCTCPSHPSILNGAIRAVYGFTNRYRRLGSRGTIDPLPPGKGFWINCSEQTNLTVQKE